MVADTPGGMVRVQAKTGRYDVRTNVIKASWDTPYTPQDCDVIAVHDPYAGITYYVDTARLIEGTTNVTIRFASSRQNGSSGIPSSECDWPSRFAKDERSEVSE